MRTLSAGMATHLATRDHTLCRMLRIDRIDGTSIGVTDHDVALDFDLGDGSISYSPATGILPSALVLTEGFDADNIEVSGPIDDVVTLADIRGGRFNRARVRFFAVNWASLADDSIDLLAGNVSDVRVEAGKFVLSIRSDIDRFNQDIGRVLSPYCTYDLGDTSCGAVLTPDEWQASTAVTVRAQWDAKVGDTVQPTTFNGFYYECSTAGTTDVAEPTWDTTPGGTTADGTAVWTTRTALAFPATVATVTSKLVFTVDAFPVSTVDDQFNLGTVEFLDGPLAGMPPVEVFDYVGSTTRRVTLFVPLAELPDIGDSLIIKVGCSKLREVCRDTFRNTLNFGGEPEVPGTDQVLKYQVPGNAGA